METEPNIRVESVSVREAAVLLRAHEDTVYKLIKSKKLVGFRMGRAIRIHKSAIRAYLRDYAT